MSLKTNLQRWQANGIIDAATAERIAAYEQGRHGFRFSTALFALGALAIFLGVAAVIGANWDGIPAWLKLAAHAAVNLGLAAGIVQAVRTERSVLREILLFLLAGLTLTFIALIGQVYQTGAPLWQALTLWMVTVSPFLFLLARARFTIVCWVLAFLATLVSAAEPLWHLLEPFKLDMAFATLIPFLLIGAGHALPLRERWPVWPRTLAMTGYIMTAWFVSWAQLGWAVDFGGEFHQDMANVYIAFCAGLAAVAALFIGRRLRILERKPEIVDLFMLVSMIAGFLPVLMAHPHWPVVGAAIFMMYWALIGWKGLRLGMRWLLNLAVIVIAVRLVIVYIEVFGSLISTGVGLIVSGLLLIALVAGMRKLIRHLGKEI